MAALPEPLVPAEVDLRDFVNMPLEFRRLFASDTWVLATDEEKLAALHLWCESWHGTPAGSLSDDDRVLAKLSQAGRDWPKVKEQALRQWIKCSDGKLYHPVVAEKALEAWAVHMKFSNRGKAGAAKRWGSSHARANAQASKMNAQAQKINGTSNAQASKTDSTSIAPAIENGCLSNAQACENDSREEKGKEKILKPSVTNTTGDQSGESQGLESLPSTPTRRRSAVEIAESAQKKAIARGA